MGWIRGQARGRVVSEIGVLDGDECDSLRIPLLCDHSEEEWGFLVREV